MIALNEDSLPRKGRKCLRIGNPWRHLSDTARHYYHVVLAILFFLMAQLLTCAWNQPFWAYGLDFPGQIVAMLFVWLAMWTIQGVFFNPGEGVDRLYHQYLRAPVSSQPP